MNYKLTTVIAGLQWFSNLRTPCTHHNKNVYTHDCMCTCIIYIWHPNPIWFSKHQSGIKIHRNLHQHQTASVNWPKSGSYHGVLQGEIQWAIVRSKWGLLDACQVMWYFCVSSIIKILLTQGDDNQTIHHTELAPTLEDTNIHKLQQRVRLHIKSNLLG